MFLERGDDSVSVALVDDLLTRTIQIVLDPDDGKAPKLKEPRSLYSLGNYHHEPRSSSNTEKLTLKNARGQ